MSYVKVVTIVFHTICDSFGMLFNLTLLYLVAFRTPSQFKVYAILIGNSAVTDFVACFSAVLVQQRIVPIKTSLIYFSYGPCRMVGAEFCYIIYCVMIFCYMHSLYSLLFSFSFRYYVLRDLQPSSQSVILFLAVVSIPSLFQLVISLYANVPVSELIPILEQELPHYNVEDEAICGHSNVFEWKTLVAIVHLILSVTMIYISILMLRRRIIALLSTHSMSENTKTVHRQLLQMANDIVFRGRRSLKKCFCTPNALTIQAMLPVVFFVSVFCYGCAQTGFYHHPFLETFIFMTLSTFSVLSPLISMYFIKPYRKAISKFLPRTLRRIASSPEDASAKCDVNAISAHTL